MDDVTIRQRAVQRLPGRCLFRLPRYEELPEALFAEKQRSVIAPSLEVSALRHQPAQHRRQILELAGDQVFDVAFALPLPVDEEQPRPEELLPLRVAKRLPAYDLDHPSSTRSAVSG